MGVQAIMNQPAQSADKRAIRNVSDTAMWVAVYRAKESERPDALFRDPYARKLAGKRGEQIAKELQFAQPEWPYAARTVRFDEIVLSRVRDGADTVINLAAGLDTRPYRLDLPPSLQWIEVDLPEITDYKEQILASEEPRCSLQRVRLDLANVEARRELFRELGSRARNALIITEGLLVYLSREQVTELGLDLAAQPSFQDWAIDLCSPGLLQMLQKNLKQLSDAGSPLKFGPEEGPDFFVPAGWKPVEVYSMLKTAAKIKRLPFFFRLLALLPESNGRQGKRPWGAVCRLTRINSQ
jgi:methyltransferase (TIGR00027 family)